MKCRKCKKGMRKAKKRVTQTRFNLFTDEAVWRMVYNCPHCGYRYSGKFSTEADFSNMREAFQTGYVRGVVVSAGDEPTLKEASDMLRGEFYTEMQCVPCPPDPELILRTEAVEEYLRRSDRFDEGIEGLRDGQPLRYDDLRQMRRFAANTLALIAHANGVDVAEFKEWIKEYNKRNKYGTQERENT